MVKLYTPKVGQILVLSLLFALSFSLHATPGNPYEPDSSAISGPPKTSFAPTKDSITAALGAGHLKCLIEIDTFCATRTVVLRAILYSTFTGVKTPLLAPWSTGETATQITVTQPGFYNYSDAGFGCDHHNTSAEINEFFNGTITLKGPPALCPGLPGTLDVTITPYYDFVTFQWTPANPSGNLTPYEFNQPGMYSLNLVDEMGCKFNKKITVPPSPPVLPVLTAPTIMCPDGDTAVIKVTPAFTSYKWEDGETTNPLTVYSPGFYTVIVTNQYGCTGEKSIAIQNGAASPFNIIATKPAICLGQLDTLFVSGGYSKYEWSNNKTGFRIVVNQPGTYTVTVTNFNGCTTTSSLTIKPLPIPSIGVSATPFCPGSTATLSVTGGIFQKYAWSSGQNTSSITISSSGTYSVTVSGSNICPTSTSTTLNVATPPNATIEPPGILNCKFQQIPLNAAASTVGPKTGLSWKTPDGNFVSGQNTLMPIVNQPGVYILSLIDSTSMCGTSDTVVVTQDILLPGADAGLPAILNCTTKTLLLGPLTAPVDPDLVPAWTTTGGNFTTAQNIWNPGINQPGSYTLVVTNIVNGCSATAGVFIGQDIAQPVAQIAPHGIITCTQGNVLLDGSGSSSGSSFTYLWTTPDGTINGDPQMPEANAASVGTYQLLVTNTQNGCTETASTTVTADSNIPIAAAATPATLTCLVKDVTIDATASSSGASFDYTWTTVNGNIQSGSNTLTPVVTKPGAYLLKLLNKDNNCSATLTVVVPEDILPPVADAGPTAVLGCVSANLTLNGAGSSTGPNFLYDWTTSDGNIFSGKTTNMPVVDKAGTYNLLVTNNVTGCTSTASVQVINDATNPVASIAPPATLTCAVAQTTIDASASSMGGNFTYTWTGVSIVSGLGSPQILIDKPGVYTLLVTNDQNGCTATTTTQVPQNILAPPAQAGPDVLLNCFQPTGSVGSVSNPTGAGYTIKWTASGGGNITTATSGPMAGVDKAGTYQVLVTDTQNGCTSTDEVLVTEDLAPPLAQAGPTLELTCAQPTVALQGSGSIGTNFSYLWTTIGGVFVSGDQTLTPVVSELGTYELLVSNTQSGCTATASVVVTSNTNLPKAAIASPAILTCTTQQTTLNANASSQGNQFTYDWTGTGIVMGQNTLQLTVNQPGVFSLLVTDKQNGCTDVATTNVVQNIVKPTALAGPDLLLNCFQPTGIVGDPNNSTGNIFSITWTTAGGNFNSQTDSTVAGIDKAGIYQISITNNQNGCTTTDDVTVTEDLMKPAANAGPGTELNCIQTSYTLQGSGSTGGIFEYLWTTMGGNIMSGSTTLTPMVNGAGIYHLLVSNTQNGCTSTAQVQVTQSADVPIAVAGPPQTLTCTFIKTTLNGAGSTAGPTYTYTWTTTNGSISNGANTLTPTIDKPGTYVIQVLNTANSCKAMSSVTIDQNIQAPVVDAGVNPTLTCSATSLPLDAKVTSSFSQNLSYLWSTSNGTILSGEDTPKPSVGAAGIYIVTVTDAANGCTGTGQVQVLKDINQPNASVANPQTLTCAVLQTSLDATASSTGTHFTYNWQTSNGNIITQQDPLKPVVNKPGIYVLTVVDNLNGCTQTTSVTVPQDIAPPLAEAGPSAVLDCDDLTTLLNGAGSSGGAIFTYSWTTGNGQIQSGANALTPKIGKPGLYVLTVKNTQNGCTKTDDVTVTQDITPPTFSIAPPATLTCSKPVITIAGTGIGFGTAPIFTWTTANGSIVNGADAQQASVDQPGIYTLTIKNTQNACTASVPVTVNQDITPPPAATKPAPLLTCTVESVGLQGIAPLQAQVQWATQNGQIVSGSSTLQPTVSKPGLYVLTVTSAQNGCTATAQVLVDQEKNIPTGIQFKLHPPLCTGKPGKLMVDQIQGGVGPFRYSIDGGQTFFPPKEFDKLQPGNFDLVIQDANGCEVKQPIQVPPPPKPLVTLPTVFTIELGAQLTLKALVPPAFPLSLIDTVLWEPLTGLSFSGNTVPEQLSPVAQPFKTTEYKVTIITPEGCQATARTSVRVIREPSIYTPNVIKPEDSDGNNSSFLIFAKEESVKMVKRLLIYDRWGNQVFENQNFPPNVPEHGWHGDFQGQKVNPAVFVWWAEVELFGGEIVLLKGDVTVVR